MEASLQRAIAVKAKVEIRVDGQRMKYVIPIELSQGVLRLQPADEDEEWLVDVDQISMLMVPKKKTPN